jgi:hypothetical protein
MVILAFIMQQLGKDPDYEYAD